MEGYWVLVWFVSILAFGVCVATLDCTLHKILAELRIANERAKEQSNG
jgi:hypothetical protein